MKLKYRLTEKDFIHFNYNQFNNWKIKIFFFIISIPILLPFIIRLIFGKMEEQTFDFGYMTIFLIPLFFILIIYFSSRNAYRKNKFLQSEIELQIDSEQVRFRGDGFETNLDFDKIHKVTLRKRYYLIYLSSKQANIIPKEQLSDEEKQEFEELVRSIPNLKITR